MTKRVAGCILAGGLSRRMGGGDKGGLEIRGRSLLARVIERLSPQVEALALNANGNPARFAAHGLPVIADSVAGHQGPLAGILAGLEWAERQGFSWLLTVPGDTPFLPLDLVARLREASRGGAAIAASNGRTHHISALWPVSCHDGLKNLLDSEGNRKVASWAEAQNPAIAAWPVAPYDPFFNINTPDDLTTAVKIAEENGL